MEERRLTLRELRILHEIEKDLHEDPAFVDRFEKAEMPESPQPHGRWAQSLRWLLAGVLVAGVCVLFAAATPAVGLMALASAAAGRMMWRLGRAVGRRRPRRRGDNGR